jgi:hypothetical protein
LGLDPPKSVVSSRLRPPVPSPARPLQEGTVPFQDLAGPPLVRFLLPRTQLRRVPLFRRDLPRGRPRGTKIARPSSVPSSGFLPLSTVPAARGSLEVFWTPPIAVAPDASRPYSMPLASLERPSRAFPSRGAVPALAGRCSHAGSLSDTPPAQCLQDFHDRFRPPRRLFAARAHPKVNPGLMRRDVGSSRSLSPVASKHRSAPHVPSASHRHWARR